MIKVVAPRPIKPESVDKAILLYKELVDESRKENGCRAYELYQLDDDPNVLVVLEEWEDKSALSVHSQSPHYTRIIPQIRELADANAAPFKGVMILNKLL
jgi:quinol monooxygenase YgiN